MCSLFAATDQGTSCSDQRVQHQYYSCTMSGTDKQKPAETSTSGAAAADSSKAGAEEAKKLPQLGALEEDDEFEEVRFIVELRRGSSCGVEENC